MDWTQWQGRAEWVPLDRWESIGELFFSRPVQVSPTLVPYFILLYFAFFFIRFDFTFSCVSNMNNIIIIDINIKLPFHFFIPFLSSFLIKWSCVDVFACRNLRTGGPTSRITTLTLGRTVWWWSGTRTANGTTFPATTTCPSPARLAQVHMGQGSGFKNCVLESGWALVIVFLKTHFTVPSPSLCVVILYLCWCYNSFMFYKLIRQVPFKINCYQ